MVFICASSLPPSLASDGLDVSPDSATNSGKLLNVSVPVSPATKDTMVLVSYIVRVN